MSTMSKNSTQIRPAVVERTMGCWNCLRSSKEAAVEFWKERRVKDLNIALQIAMNDPAGEKHPQVINIRRMVDQVDQGIAAGLFVRCRVGGSEADLISLTHLCDKWTAASGASVARDGQKVDKLPDELMEDHLADPLKTRKIQ